MIGAAAFALQPNGRSGRITVGIGDYAVSNDPTCTIVTHALGSCVAVCLWDPAVRVGAMLHFLLPEARLNPDRAHRQPGTFADTGIPLLFQTAYRYGLDKKRCRVHLLGGAAMAHAPSGMDIGRRNGLAAKKLLWQNGVFIHTESLGGTDVRTVHLSLADGQIQVFSGRGLVEEIA